jgi:cephalosporin hydroxylase
VHLAKCRTPRSFSPAQSASLKLTIDTEAGTLTQEADGQVRTVGLYTNDAFELLSLQWLRVGWNQKYSYSFTWLGRPIIQLPEDLIRIQEVIYTVKPDVIIETGVAHGGSLVFYASLCKAMGKGRVVGIDIEIRPHNRKAVESHELFPYITLIEGSSTDPAVVSRVKSLVRPAEQVLVLLDSNHSKQHVLSELIAYHDLVKPGSYLVAADGIMKDLHDVPRGQPDWQWNNPAAAAADFVRDHPDFVIEQPAWIFKESTTSSSVTYLPGAWLRKK